LDWDSDQIISASSSYQTHRNSVHSCPDRASRSPLLSGAGRGVSANEIRECKCGREREHTIKSASGVTKAVPQTSPPLRFETLRVLFLVSAQQVAPVDRRAGIGERWPLASSPTSEGAPCSAGCYQFQECFQPAEDKKTVTPYHRRLPILAGRLCLADSASIWLVRMTAELRSPASTSGRMASEILNSSGFSVVVMNVYIP